MIDTHCHLNDPEAFPDPAATVAAAREARVERMLVVGIEPAGWRSALGLAEQFEEVAAILGWHPNHAAEYTGLAELESMLSHPKVVALGEIGLDYHWDYATPKQQKFALLEQLELARKVSKPVVFHCRDAYSDLLDILESQEPQPYLFHCFAGNLEDAARALAIGGYFGVDGPITYKNAHELRSVIATLPRERLVIETDSPYMAPTPHRGKTNQPAYVRFVNAGLATVMAISEDECAALTTANAVRFFGL